MANIGLRGVEKYFGANYVIRQLNLEIANGEFVVLLGPSGCGKTTTLRAIAGLEEIDKGAITIDEKPVQDLTPGERDIAFVFQLFALYPHLTAFDNIAFPLRATGEDRAEIERKVQGRGGLAPHRAAARQAAVGALRRRPAAGGDRPRAGAAAEGAPDGRADRRARRQAPRGHARRAEAAAHRERHHQRLRHPRPGRGDEPRRPGRGDERRGAAAGGDAVGGLPQPGQPLRRAVRGLAGDEHRAGRGPRRGRTRPASRSAAGRPSAFRASSRRGSARRCPPGTSWWWASAPRR